MDIISAVMDRIALGDRDGGVEFIVKWSQDKDNENSFINVLELLLMKVGEQWQLGNLSLAQVYVATKIVEDIINLKCCKLNNLGEHETALKGPVVIGNVEDDFHGLGRKMVIAFLKASGWEVIDLGNDVLPEVFVDKAVEIGAPIIAVSAMMYTTACNIKKIRVVLNERGLSSKIMLAVGGAVFRLRPELIEEFGADGTVATAMEAPACFENLLKSLKEKEA